MTERVSVNILNWNRPLDTIECVESCRRLRYPHYEILIIDNGSADDSVAQFRARWPELAILENRDNLGYAGGNNVGMRHALERGAEYVLILNNDVVVEPDLLDLLVQAMRDHPQAGLAAPKVRYADQRDLINSLGTSMDWLRLRPFLGACGQRDDGSWPTDGFLKKDILVGCALLVPRSTIERIGVIDERYFIFHEEADWCYRNLQSGFDNLVVPQAVVYHQGSKTMRDYSALTHYYSTRNFLYLAAKHASWGQRLLMWIGVGAFSVKHAASGLGGDPAKHRLAQAFFWGLGDYLAGRMGRCAREL